MRPQDAIPDLQEEKETLAGVLADFLNLIDEAVDRDITDDDVETRLRWLTQTATRTHGAGPRPAPPRAVRATRDAEFSRFYRRFVSTLVAFLWWQGVPLREAADVAQETMAEAYRSWATIRNPQAWARRAASRTWERRIAGRAEDWRR
jgi:hypothetical protein